MVMYPLDPNHQKHRAKNLMGGRGNWGKYMGRRSKPGFLAEWHTIKSQSVLCDWAGYLARYPDLTTAFGENVSRAAVHYREWGEREGRVVYPIGCRAMANSTRAP
jgi:hypothetical protein